MVGKIFIRYIHIHAYMWSKTVQDNKHVLQERTS